MPLKAEKKLDAILARLDEVMFVQLELLAETAILVRTLNPPKKIKLRIRGDENMSDTIFTGVQSSTVTIELLDASGNVVPGALIDAGTLVASFADGTTSFTLSPGADTGSFGVTSVAGAPTITDDVLTVNGTFSGVALTPGTLAFDIAAPADTPVSISLSASTPA